MDDFDFFSAIINLVRELVICNIHNKFGKDTWKTFQVIAPTRSIIVEVKCEKAQ